MTEKIEFETVIMAAQRGGAYLACPVDIKARFGKGRLKVSATFDGHPYLGSVVNMGVKHPDGSICYIIGIQKAIRQQIGKDIGDRVTVTLKPILEATKDSK